MTSTCEYRAIYIVYYLDQPMHNININNEFLYRIVFLQMSYILACWVSTNFMHIPRILYFFII